jgi:hypothetical protein
MPWREPQSAPFTRIGIVSQVPSESGVFGLFSGNTCLLIAESWNLRARLLDLINTITEPVELTAVFELCPEAEAEPRRDELRREFLAPRRVPAPESETDKKLPGISFWLNDDAVDPAAEPREL